MKTTRVVVGSESSKGASMMMSKASAMAEKTRQMSKEETKIPVHSESVTIERKAFNSKSEEKIGQTSIDKLLSLENELCPMPIDRVDEHVYIGNRIAASEIEYLRNNGITHIVNTAGEIPNYFEKTGITYIHLQLNDDPRPSIENLLKILEPTYKFIKSAIASNPKARILVHCAAGVSRSASIVIYYLMKTYSLSFEKALAGLKKIRNCVNPNDWYKSQLRDAQTIIENERGKLL